MPTYIWQRDSWPSFSYKAEALLPQLGQCRKLQGELLTQLSALDEKLALEAEALFLETEIVRTSEIEGVKLHPQSVRSSVARKLGLDDAGYHPRNQYEDGMIEVLVDATVNHKTPLTAERLYGWHAALFPTGYTGTQRITVGDWRTDADGSMQVISGRPGKTKLHYEAPPAEALPNEMEAFLDWFNSPVDGDGIIRAGIAHFWFVTLHPFDDGNGRLARAITDMAMSQDEKTSRRAYSLSSQISASRKAYYAVLEETQRGEGDLTGWLAWFLETVELGMLKSREIAELTIRKAEYWKRHASAPINDRQRKALNKLLDAGPDGFEGGLSNKKYIGMTKTSSATATRDLKALVEAGLLVQSGGGRSIRYAIAWV
ncbi:Fic family protein [Pseudodesulfovibrio sp. zrk46]|uniref:Fic family protein n=1 Tax=Pseudodesulfovibrio sp. zrk46 TaxID=2725288 RepID=UPI001449D593|nr:Fic family protein [Pseudodesulfovibrio sp. zrk46]QJB56534.1 Fic family protein [Pseudodesulfovibrio sp. zrk46]